MKDKMLLPNFYGIFEVKSLTKNRLRIEIDKLKNNREEINELTENLKKISVIKNFKIVQSLGSLTVEFDDSQIDDELLKDRKGKIKDTFLNLGKLADITVYNKTKGLFDAKTLAGTMLLIYGIKKFKNEMFLPSGATLIWWAYRLLSKKGV